MVRLLLLILLVVAAWLIYQGIVGRSKSRRAGDDEIVSRQEQIRACALCGLHVPESEGVRAGDRFYCCEAHRQQADGPDAG